MKICPKLASILADRDNLINVIVTNIIGPNDLDLIRKVKGLRPSKIKGDKVFVGALRPSEIRHLVDVSDHRTKIEFEPAVPRSQH